MNVSTCKGFAEYKSITLNTETIFNFTQPAQLQVNLGNVKIRFNHLNSEWNEINLKMNKMERQLLRVLTIY